MPRFLSQDKPELALPDKPSIAVLPFTNMSGDHEQEYFSDGITDDLVTDLSRLPGLFVTLESPRSRIGERRRSSRSSKALRIAKATR